MVKIKLIQESKIIIGEFEYIKLLDHELNIGNE